MPIDPFGDEINLHYHPRVQGAQLATQPRRAPTRTSSTNPGPAQEAVQLNGERVLSERGLLRAIADESDVQNARVIALHAFNDMNQRVGDLLTGHRTVSVRNNDGADLSSFGNSPDGTTEGLPVAVRIGDQQRLRADTRWIALFAVQDLRQNSHPYFKIADVFNALTFKEYTLGDRVDMGFVKTSEQIYEALIYAAGLQWNMLWGEWQSLWQSGDGLAAMQAKYLNFQAKTAYQIITDTTDITTVSYQGATDDSQTRRDIKTLNEGVRTIKQQLFEKQGPDGEPLEEDLENATFYVIYDSLQQGIEERINNALETRLTVDADGQAEVSEVKYNIVPIGTPYVDGVTVALSERKNVLGLSRDLTMYDTMDARIAGVAEGSVAQAAWRMVRGSSDQSVKTEMS